MVVNSSEILLFSSIATVDESSFIVIVIIKVTNIRRLREIIRKISFNLLMFQCLLKFLCKIFQGDHIWAKQVTNGEFDIPVGGKITSIEATRVKIRDDDDKEFYVSNQQLLKTMHISSIKGVEDMINLGDLQEHAILRNLHKRYKEKLIYVSENF